MPWRPTRNNWEKIESFWRVHPNALQSAEIVWNWACEIEHLDDIIIDSILLFDTAMALWSVGRTMANGGALHPKKFMENRGGERGTIIRN